MSSDAVRRPEDLFQGHARGLAICRRVQQAVSALGPATMTVTKSQVAFQRLKGFAYVWRPGRYVDSDVPAVLSLALPYEASSDRFKEVVHPSRGVWMHHIELNEADEVDDLVCGWLAAAYENAG